MIDPINLKNDTDPNDGIMPAIQRWVAASSGLAADKVLWALYANGRPAAPYIWMTVDLIRPVGHDYATSEDNHLDVGITGATADPTTDQIHKVAHQLENGDGPIQLAAGTLPAPLQASTDYWVIYVDADNFKLAATYENTGGQMPLGAGNPITPINLTTAGSGAIAISSTEDTVPAGKEIVRRAQGIREVTIGLECYGLEKSGVDAMRILANVMAALQLYVYDLDQAGFGVSDFGQGYEQGGVQAVPGSRGSILEPRAKVQLVGYAASSVIGFETIIASVDASIVLDSEGGTPLPPISLHIP